MIRIQQPVGMNEMVTLHHVLNTHYNGSSEVDDVLAWVFNKHHVTLDLYGHVSVTKDNIDCLLRFCNDEGQRSFTFAAYMLKTFGLEPRAVTPPDVIVTILIRRIADLKARGEAQKQRLV